MADTILAPALTPVLPESAKTFVYAGGTLAILADGAAYPAGLVKIPAAKFVFTPKVEFGTKKGVNPTTKVIEPVRTWVKSKEYSAKVTSAEALNPFVATLAAAGYVHGKFKLLAKDQSDEATEAALVIGEFTGVITIDGDFSADEGESPDISYAIQIEGTPAFNFAVSMA